MLPVTYERVTTQTFASPQEALAACYEPTMLTALAESLRREMQKMRQRQHKLQKKVANLRQDYEDARVTCPISITAPARRPAPATRHALTLRWRLLQSRTGPSPFLLTHDSLQENAQVYFKKYRKAKSGMTKVQALLKQAAAETRPLRSWPCRSNTLRIGPRCKGLLTI